MSLRQIAAQLNCSHVAVGFYINGSRLPSAVRFGALVALLGADADERVALMEAHQRIAGRLPVPRALPLRAAGFIGREAPLGLLDGLLRAAEGSARIATVVGMPGVGKTALVVRWAHQVSAFPGGRLYVDLQGHSPHSPLSTMDALGVLLAAMEVDLDALRDVASRSERYQELVSGRSMLVVLDNVASLDQLRAILPPPPSVAVVTSRSELTGIDELGDLIQIRLDPLPEGEAVALLRLLVGERVGREPRAARALAARCGYLPLALRVAAEQASSRPGASLADLVGELDENAGPLGTLATPGDVRADLRSVFSWSVDRLPAPTVRLFCLMALIPGFDIDRYGLAALAGADLGETDELARSLAAAHLVESRAAGRFVMHDLLRAYAAETVEQRMSTEDRRAAVERLLRYYLDVTITAVDLMFPTHRQVVPVGDAQRTHQQQSGLGLADAGAAAAWLATERVNLVRACEQAAGNGWPREAIAFAHTLGRYLEDLHYEDALTLYRAAAKAVESLGDECDQADRAGVWTGLGLAHWRLGDLVTAQAYLESAYEANLAAGDTAAAARSLSILRVVLDGLGRYREAIACQQRGLDLARASRLPGQVALALSNLAAAYWRVEEYETAIGLDEQARSVAEQAGETWPLGPIFEGIAWDLVGLGRYQEALTWVEESLAAYRSFAQVVYRLRAEVVLASALRGLGRYAEAVDHLTEALRECRDHGNPRPTTLLLNTLGEIYNDLGDAEQARACHAEALALARRHGNEAERTRALVGLGDSYAATGDQERAGDHWQQAYDAYAAAGVPAAERLRARLNGLPQPGLRWERQHYGHLP